VLFDVLDFPKAFQFQACAMLDGVQLQVGTGQGHGVRRVVSPILSFLRRHVSLSVLPVLGFILVASGSFAIRP
jgi:hypothetical protein